MSLLRSLPSLSPASSSAGVALILLTAAWPLAAEAKGTGAKRSPVVGMITEGIAEKLHSMPKAKKGKKSSEVGRVFTAVCDGSVTHWKVSDLGDDGAWVGAFVGGVRPKRCMLLEREGVTAAKGRPNASAAQIANAKVAALAALTPKKGEAPKIADVVVFHDGEQFVAVAQATRPATGRGNCLDNTSLVVLAEVEGVWKPIFRPAGKGKDVCGYSFFTRGDVDGDGRDEIALRIDKGDGYGYRVLKHAKGTYSLLTR